MTRGPIGTIRVPLRDVMDRHAGGLLIVSLAALGSLVVDLLIGHFVGEVARGIFLFLAASAVACGIAAIVFSYTRSTPLSEIVSDAHDDALARPIPVDWSSSAVMVFDADGMVLSGNTLARTVLHRASQHTSGSASELGFVAKFLSEAQVGDLRQPTVVWDDAAGVREPYVVFSRPLAVDGHPGSVLAVAWNAAEAFSVLDDEATRTWHPLESCRPESENRLDIFLPSNIQRFRADDRHRIGATDVVEEVARVVQPTAARRGVALLVDLAADAQLYVDSDAISRALEHYLDEAIVASPPGGVVTLGCEVIDGHVEFSIVDNAYGAPTGPTVVLSDDHEGIFRTRPAPSARAAYARRAVTRHRGTTHIEESGDAGSLVRIRIPVAGR